MCAALNIGLQAGHGVLPYMEQCVAMFYAVGLLWWWTGARQQWQPAGF